MAPYVRANSSAFCNAAVQRETEWGSEVFFFFSPFFFFFFFFLGGGGGVVVSNQLSGVQKVEKRKVKNQEQD